MSHMASRRAAWGGAPDLSPWEAVMWRAEGDHRTRSTGVLVEILDSVPDWERLVAAHERLTRAIPRMRERIVEPIVPVGPPVWSPDQHFDLTYHVQRARLPGDGADGELWNFVSQFASRPLDPQRPPWEAVLVDGLAGGKAAYLFKPHHSLTDGLGLLQLLELTHGRDREPQSLADTEASVSGRAESTPLGLVADRLADAAISVPSSAIRGALRGIAAITADPAAAATAVLRFSESLRRVMAPVGAKRSPLLNGGGPGYRLVLLDVPLSDLKAAARAANGSVNDAFLASILGAVRRYHERFGVAVDAIPMAIPISLRASDDPMGGNRFAAARFAAPVAEPEPTARIAAIQGVIAAARSEPALGFLDLLAPVLQALPGAVLTRIAGEMAGAIDVQASNLGAVGRELYLAGARVEGVYPMGPRPGVAAMVTLVSYDGICCIAANLDPESITDTPAFLECLHEGFDEVIRLGST